MTRFDEHVRQMGYRALNISCLKHQWTVIPAFWKRFLFDHLGPAFQYILLQDVEVDNSEEVNGEAEDQKVIMP